MLKEEAKHVPMDTDTPAVAGVCAPGNKYIYMADTVNMCILNFYKTGNCLFLVIILRIR